MEPYGFNYFEKMIKAAKTLVQIMQNFKHGELKI